MAFQINWILTSRKLIEEQFDQKVNLAMGSALDDFNKRYKKDIHLEDWEDCGDDYRYKVIPNSKGELSLEEQRGLKASLGNYMKCYGIAEKYKAEVFYNSCPVGEKSYCCTIKTGKNCDQMFSLGVSFLSKKDYLFDKMKFMILSSALIFILLSSVSFLILRALIRQKRITDNNIDFFNNTAHELKTPLTNISLALNLLKRKNEHLQSDRYAHIIKSETTKLADQIERVLFLSRMENGEYKIKKEQVNLNKIIAEVVENMQMRIEQEKGQITFHPLQEPAIVLGDYYHLSNVFKNLIDNAIKYCDSAPTIDIHIKKTAEDIRIKISDNGVGISKHDQEHIFEKFQRVNTGNVRDAKGFGIGLSYVKTVIELHKGLIQVHSELKKGSQFELGIPNA